MFWLHLKGNETQKYWVQDRSKMLLKLWTLFLLLKLLISVGSKGYLSLKIFRDYRLKILVTLTVLQNLKILLRLKIVWRLLVIDRIMLRLVLNTLIQIDMNWEGSKIISSLEFLKPLIRIDAIQQTCLNLSKHVWTSSIVTMIWFDTILKHV